MIWADIRKTYPGQWLIVEALEAHTTPENRRVLDRLAVIDTCTDGNAAMQRYRDLHRQYQLREFYFVHTERENLEIYERYWSGVRLAHGITTQA